MERPSEAQARTSLRQALAALRRDLCGIEPTPLTIDGDAVALDGLAFSTDVASFEGWRRREGEAHEWRHVSLWHFSEVRAAAVDSRLLN